MTAGAVRGDLSASGLPQVLRPLVRARKTGVLRCTRDRFVKTVYISDGRLIFATSTDPDDRLGEMLMRKGLITYRGLEDSVQALQAGKRQGTILVESGAIRSRDLVQGVAEQVQEIVHGLIQWDAGQYEFVEGDLPSKEVIVLRMSTGDLLLEGIRRVQRWSRIRAGAGGLDQKYALAPDSSAVVSALSLQKDELNVVASLDGVMTLEEVCAASRQNDYGVCRAVWGLWAAGVLDRVPQDALAERKEKTEPHAEQVRGASIGREIERFNRLHSFLYELVSWELRERAAAFFERAFSQATQEHPTLFDGVAVDGGGSLDAIALRRNIVGGEIARYMSGLERLLEIEQALVRETMGERKAAIIRDGLKELRAQRTHPPR
ncbi:MAG TPA: DUF4388 domain-containing protein [Vicinamibacteria bacterium]|jgi:hypothetical protein